MFFVFDVESIGLHGEGFAFGYQVVDRLGKPIASGCFACNPAAAQGDDEGREWVSKNISDISADRVYETPAEVRSQFWEIWQYHRGRGALMVADCAWPVEARFLAACVDDDPKVRCFEGPYPLHDVASFRMAAGLDPLATVDRMPDELPIHDPLADARQSARLLIEALNKIVYIA